MDAPNAVAGTRLHAGQLAMTRQRRGAELRPEGPPGPRRSRPSASHDRPPAGSRTRPDPFEPNGRAAGSARTSISRAGVELGLISEEVLTEMFRRRPADSC